MNTGKVAIGVLAGVAAGAIIGILFAPDKGTETRRKISGKASDSVVDFKDKFEEMLCNISEKFEILKQDVNDLCKKGKNAVV